MKYRAFIYSLFIAVLLMPVIIYLQQKLPFMQDLLHSDALYGPFLIEDVLKDFGRYNEWHVSPNPALFPDWFGYLAAYIVTRDHYLSVPIYLVYQLTLLSLVIYSLYRKMFNVDLALTTTLLVVATLTSIAVIANGPPFSFLFMSGHHIGNLVMMVAIVWLYLEILNRDRPLRYAAALFVVLFLASLSDRLIIVNTVVPIVIITAVLTGYQHIRIAAALRIYCALALGSAGMYFSKYTMPYEVDYANYGFSPSIYKIPYGLEILTDVLRQSYQGTPLWLSATLTAVGSVVLAVALYKVACSATKPAIMIKQPVILSAFLLLSIACAIGAPVLHATIFPRYLLPLYVLPFILLPALFINGKWLTHIATLRVIIAFAICPIVANIYIAQSGDRSLKQFYYPADVACIDQALASQEVTYGIAQYWDARYISAYARNSSPEIAHVYPNLTPYRWMISERQFRERYDFAIIHLQTYPIYTLNEQYLMTLNGQPSFTAQCGVRKLLVWDGDLTTGS